MARTGKNNLVYHGEYAFASYLDQITTSREADALEDTTYGDSGRTYLKGQRTGTASISGFYDNAGLADPLDASLGGIDVPVSIVFGNAVDSKAVIMKAIEASVTSSASVTALTRLDAEYQPSANGLEGGVLVLPSTTTSGAATAYCTIVDKGNTDETGGSYANLHILAAGASGTLDVTVETSSSATFSSDVSTALTFTQVTTSETSEFKDSAVTVKRYNRVKYVTVGGSSAYTLVVTFGHYR